MRTATMLLALLVFLVSPIPTRAQEEPACQTADPEAFARGWLEAWNSRDVDRILTFYADDAVYEDVPSVTNGWAAPWRGHGMIREALVDGYEAMPDMGFETVSASGAGDRMVVEWVMTGTQTGDYPGLPATGRSISIRGLSLLELEGGKITSQRDYYDTHLLLTQLGAVPSTPSSAAAPERTASLVRGVFEVWNGGDLSAIDELFTPDFVGHFPERKVHGPDELRAEVTLHRKAFPDWTEEVQETVVDGDRIVVRFTSGGTNLGKFLSRPPTGKRVRISEMVMFRVRDGKIAEQWVYPDILSMQRQLGSIPGAGGE